MIVTAYMANIRTAMNRGAFEFLTKPIDFLRPGDDDCQDAPAPPTCCGRPGGALARCSPGGWRAVLMIDLGADPESGTESPARR